MRQSAREMAQTPQKLKLRWRCATRSILIRRQTQIHRSFNHSHLIYSFRTKIQWGMFLGVVRNSRGIQLQEGNMWPEGPEQTSVLQSHLSSILSLIVKNAGKYLNLLIVRLKTEMWRSVSLSLFLRPLSLGQVNRNKKSNTESVSHYATEKKLTQKSGPK